MGLSVDKALEIIDYYHPKQGVHPYLAYFSVAGELREDNLTILDDDAKITLYRLDTEKPIYINTDMPMPSFILEVQVSELPWEIDEAED